MAVIRFADLELLEKKFFSGALKFRDQQNARRELSFARRKKNRRKIFLAMTGAEPRYSGILLLNLLMKLP
jgi:hypothetical protein